MGSYVVVAIPTKGDPVYKVSTEPVPHMTILYVDDSLENKEQVLEYLEHVCDTSLTTFGLDVARREVLGPKEADVLCFSQWGIQKVEEARGYLLKNHDLQTAYNKAEQFPDWVPHLTLGYPEKPAHDDAIEYPLSWVNFDRLALWDDDYKGPEFRLKGSSLGVAMNFETSEEALRHFGIPGMKWGRRKAQVTPDPRAAKNMDTEASRAAERRRSTRKKLLIAGAVYVGLMLITHGSGLAQGAANNYVAKKTAANGAKAAANLLADSRGIGSHKIVDLGFDAAKGVWG